MEIKVVHQQVIIKSDVILKGTIMLPKTEEGLLPAILILRYFRL